VIAIDIDNRLAQLSSVADVRLPATARDKLLAYVDLLAKWNRTYSLTAIREPERMVTHHLLDSLAVLPHLAALNVANGLRLLDVGSGAGVPAIPLAIARPAWRVVALDSSHKKGAFVQQALAELGLDNVEAIVARVDDYRAPAPFDVVISRAFSDLATFAEAGLRHLASAGRLIAMKGVRPDEEIAQLPPTVRVVATPAVAVPGIDAARHLVVMERA
jgi:16S rRNA (guanine527-N7)-methyltransferase